MPVLIVAVLLSQPLDQTGWVRSKHGSCGCPKFPPMASFFDRDIRLQS